MSKKSIKTLIKLMIVGILVFGFYQSQNLTPVEERRATAAIDNFQSLNSFQVNFEGYIEETDTRVYEAKMNSYFNRTDSGLKSKGEFSLKIPNENSSEKIEGELITTEESFFILPDPESISVIEELGYSDFTERELNSWMKYDLDNPTEDIKIYPDSTITISEDEKINDTEVYHYRTELSGFNFLEEDFEVDLFTGKEDLNIYRISTKQEINFSKDVDFFHSAMNFSTGSSPTLDFQIEFSGFNEEKEIQLPEEYMDI